MNHRIAEVIVDDGVEMTLEHIGEYHDFLIEHLEVGSGLLINKSTSYTYSFEAQQHIFLPERIKAYAVYTPSVSAKLATDSVVMMQRKKLPVTLKTFEDYDEAMTWLKSVIQPDADTNAKA
ncbi:MAG TPA: hypothetical protein DCM28_21360 [Phycisphaerales bacterium]|nr:hypothetical protein [Phycisphaerales bacterium]HCD34974.1 hypothetical protein [Phycisphaerales bacterium]